MIKDPGMGKIFLDYPGRPSGIKRLLKSREPFPAVVRNTTQLDLRTEKWGPQPRKPGGL